MMRFCAAATFILVLAIVALPIGFSAPVLGICICAAAWRCLEQRDESCARATSDAVERTRSVMGEMEVRSK